MKVLVIGSGGREHALAWKLAQSARVQQVFVAPGNGGTARDPRLKNIAITDPAALADFAAAEKIGLTVVGPEAPLSQGVVDIFRARRLRIFGPTKAAAQLESSKAFAKDFMARHGIPTAHYATFTDPAAAHAHVDSVGAPIVVKADGLAAGKGVVVAMTLAEAHEAIDFMLVDNTLGVQHNAGADGLAMPRVVIEEFLQGELGITTQSLLPPPGAPWLRQGAKELAAISMSGVGVIDEATRTHVSHAQLVRLWPTGCAAVGLALAMAGDGPQLNFRKGEFAYRSDLALLREKAPLFAGFAAAILLCVAGWAWATLKVLDREARGGESYFGSKLHQLNRRYAQFVTRTIADGIARGELRADLDPQMARDFLFGGLEHWVRNTVGRGRRNDATAVAREMVRLLLDGWAAAPAKGAAAPWQGLEARIAKLEGRLKPAARTRETEESK